MHKLLARQLRRVYGSVEQVPEAVRPLLAIIDAAYETNDRDRRLLEHAMETASEELVERHRAQRELEALRAQAELWRSEHRYQLVFEHSPRPMWVYDAETLRFLAVNAAAVREYGYSVEEFLAMTLRDVSLPDDAPATDRAIAERDTAYDPLSAARHRTRDGKVIDVEITSHALEFDGRSARLALMSDVSERNQLEAQLRQAQKMEAVGRLAGGIAHDFNNLLTVVRIHGEFLRDAIDETQAEREHVDEIRKAVERAAALTRQLLAFSRQQVLRPQDLDLNATVKEVHKMLSRLVGEDVVLSLALQDDLGHVMADPGQMEQVLMNLVVNACDAMPAGGEITIRTRSLELAEGQAAGDRTMPPGSYVTLAVTDNGTGMDDATRARVFEPFFTTKEPGKGTGLGLSTVYGIVQQSGGDVRIASELGQGTTVTILLPRVEVARQAAEPVAPASQAPPGRETVLLVEDEEGVRALARRILERQGYRVLEARDGRHAMGVARAFTGTIDLLLTDVVMPEMSGPDLVRALSALRPDVRVLLMSGYAGDDIVRRGVREVSATFLNKPFTSADFTRAVREALDAPRSGARVLQPASG